MSSNPWDFSGGGTGGGNPWDLSAPAAPTPAAPQAPQEQGLLGGLLNMPLALVKGLKDFAVGIGQLGGASLHDTGHAIAKFIPGGQDWGPISDNPRQSYLTPQIGASLIGLNQPEHPGFHPTQSTLVHDYVTRYGPLFQGHVADFLKQVEQKPLSFALDAGAVAGAAAKGAGIAGEAGILASPEAAAAREGALAAMLPAGADAIPTGISEAMAGQAATRAGLDVLAEQGTLNPLQNLLRRALPKMDYTVAQGGETGAQFLPTVAPKNPVLRGIDSLAKKLTSESLPSYEAKIANLNATLAQDEIAGTTPFTDTLVQRNILQATLDKARELGVGRIPGETTQKFQTWRLGGKIVSNSSWLKSRIVEAQPYLQDIRATIEKDPTVADTYNLTSRGVDVAFAGMEPDSNIARRLQATGLPEKTIALDERAMQPVGQASLGFHGDAPIQYAKAPMAPVTDAMLPAAEMQAAEKVVPDLAQRTQAIQSQLDSFIAERTANQEAYAASGWDVANEIDSAKRIQRQLSDGLTRLSGDASGNDVIPEGVLLSDRNRIRDLEARVPMMTPEVPRTSPTSYLNHSFDELRMKYGGDYLGREARGGPDVKSMEQALHDAKVPAPTYFPSIDAERLSNADFFRARKLTGVAAAAADKSEKQSLGILFRKGTEVTDPYEAWSRRASRATRAHTSLELHDSLVKMTGMPWEPQPGGIVPKGWKLASLDSIHLNHAAHLQFLDSVDRYVSQGMDHQDAFAKAMDEMHSFTLSQMDQMASATGKAGKFYLVPEVVAKRLDEASNLAKVFGGKNVTLFWDKPMNVWRSFVLTGSPRWVVNNTLGNMTFAFMQGAKIKDAMSIMGERFRAMLMRWIGDPEAFGGSFVHDSALAKHIRALAEDPLQSPNSWLNASVREKTLAGQVQRLPAWENVGSGYAGDALSQRNPNLSPEAQATRTGRLIAKYQGGRLANRLGNYGDAVKHLNAEIESSFRDASYLTAAEKSVGKSAIQRTVRTFMDSQNRIDSLMKLGFNESNPVKIIDALKAVDHYLGRFDNLGPLERHVIRRFLFPFWGFYRFQINLLVKFPFESPLRASVITQLGKASADMMQQYGPLPEWLQGATPLGPPGGNVPFSSNRGPDPFSGTFTDWTSQLNPAIKMGIERATGKSLFSGKTFTDPNVVTPFGSSISYSIIRDSTGRPVDAQPIQGHVLPSPVEQALQNIPQYQTLKNMLSGGATYDTASLVPGAGPWAPGEGTIRNSDGTTKYPGSKVSEIAKLFGFPSTSYDLSKYQASLDQGRQEALREALSRYLAGAA